MKFGPKTTRKILLVLVLLFTLTGLLWTSKKATVKYPSLDKGKYPTLDKIKGFYNDKISAFQKKPNDHLVVYPRSFSSESKEKLEDHFNTYLGGITGNLKVLSYNGPKSPLTNKIREDKYHKHEISLYDSVKDIGGDVDKCQPDINKKIKLDVTNSNTFGFSFEKIVRKLVQQLKDDPAILELKGFFNEDLEKHLEEGKTGDHWFKFAGTSVWLEQYGVHFMISRMMYSPPGPKKRSVLSLLYGQVYDEDWNEIENIDLIMPSSDSLTNDKSFRSINFPSFLPIPFYHDANYLLKRFYGPEDARMLLVKNDNGIEEPLIVFNAYHRKGSDEIKIDEASSSIKFEYYRSMFVGWPFQFQLGKQNVDGSLNPKHANNEYTKITELRNIASPRLKVQKNWTPFVSNKARQVDGYDKNIYFVYRWQSLEIMKCQLTSITDVSQCTFEYKRVDDLPIDASVGDLRGGTELISINNIFPSLDSHFKSDTEVWVGFSRAHIKSCGCGSSMYRPNLAILYKDGNKFKISQLSEFFSLDVKVTGWSDPEKVCQSREPDALIPNGISSWDVNSHMSGLEQVHEDYITLILSAGDAVDHKIHIKNLLKAIIGQTSLLSSKEENGYNDDLVLCSLRYSKDFCAAYGKEQLKEN